MATSSHPPGDDRIFFKEARSLAKAGASVTLVHSDKLKVPSERSGIGFVGYPGGGSLRRRAVTLHHLEAAIARSGCRVVHCHEPDSLLAALRVKRRLGVKVVFDSHEMWGGVFAGRFPRSFWAVASKAFQQVERRWLVACDAAIGASWAISDYLKDAIGPGRVATILNVPVVEVFGHHGERSWGEETILCHDGHLSFDRGLKTMVAALRLVSARHPVRLKIVGDVFGGERTWLDGYVARHGLGDRVVRTGWLEYREVGRALTECHIGLIALQRTPNNIVTSSNKVFNYMLYGIPFVGPTFRLAKQKLVTEEACGLLADSADPESYASAITRMIEDRAETMRMSTRAVAASRTKYRWEHMEPLLVGLYERVLSDSGA